MDRELQAFQWLLDNPLYTAEQAWDFDFTNPDDFAFATLYAMGDD